MDLVTICNLPFWFSPFANVNSLSSCDLTFQQVVRCLGKAWWVCSANNHGKRVDKLVRQEYKTAMKSGKIQHCKFEELLGSESTWTLFPNFWNFDSNCELSGYVWLRSYIWNDLYVTETEFNMTCIEFELQVPALIAKSFQRFLQRPPWEAANIFTRNTVLGSGKALD